MVRGRKINAFTLFKIILRVRKHLTNKMCILYSVVDDSVPIYRKPIKTHQINHAVNPKYKSSGSCYEYNNKKFNSNQNQFKMPKFL